MNFSKTFLAGLLAFVVGNILIAVLWSLFVMGIVGALSATTGIDDNSILRIDLSERRFPYDDCHAPRDPVRGAARDRCRQERSPHQGNLYPAQRAGYGLDGRVGGVACGDPRLQAGERQVRAGLQRSLRAGRLLPRHGGRRRLSSTRRIARLARNGRQHAIFQGAARQTRSQSRGVPSYGLQVQECRGTLHPHEAVRCQSGTVGAAGALDVERHCG